MVKQEIKLFLEKKFKNCSFILTGSYVIGNFKSKSDIDIIVLSPDIAISYNEKIYANELDKYIDCLVIPKNRIIEEIEKSFASNSGALIRMIAKGEILLDREESLNSVFELCNFYYAKGKEYQLDEHEIKNKCIKISNAIEDLAESEKNIERHILFSKIFDELSKLYCIANNIWQNSGKARLSEIILVAPNFIEDFDNLAEKIFTKSKIDTEVINILSKHLNKFHDFHNIYSTRKGLLKNKNLIEILDVSPTDYKVVINLISYNFNRKYKLYLKSFSFEYIDTQAKALLAFELSDDTANLEKLDIFNAIKSDILTSLSCYLTQNFTFKATLGGEILYYKYEEFKNKLSYNLTQYINSKNLDYKNEDIFGPAFILSLYIYKIIDNNFQERFSHYMFEYFLPSAYDIRALKSYEELLFEKEKVVNHFKLRYDNNKSNYKTFIKDFLIDDNNESEEIFDSSPLLVEFQDSIKQMIFSINNNEKEFFFYEYDNVDIDSIEDAKLFISYKKMLESSFNTLGVPSIDRAFIFYTLNNQHHA